MSKRIDHNFETEEEFVSWVIQNHDYADTRFRLSIDIEHEFVDPVLGEKWEEERGAIKWVSYSDPDYSEYQAKAKEVESRRPEMKVVKKYSLWESSNSWYHTTHTFFLSPVLGEKVDSIWTKKHVYENRYQNTSSLSLKGILKRLGKTDIGDKIKEIEKKEKLQQEKNVRNNRRGYIREYASKLKDILDEHGNELNLHPNVSVSDLLNIVDEE